MFLDKVDLLVLEELGQDSRVHLKTIAEKAGVSIQTISSRLGNIEKKLGLRYSLEFDLDAAGMRSEHFIRVKFRDGAAPDADVLRNALASPYVQLACRTKGDFDWFIWAVTPTPQKFSSEVEPSIREALDEYVEDWTSHPLISRRTGFLPVSRELVEQFIAPNSRRKVLGILNENSRMMVMELADQLGVSEPTAEYHLKKVRPFVKRFTVFFEGKGDFARAEAAYREAISEDPGRPDPLQALYQLYLEDLHDTSKARGLLQQWLQRAPKDSVASKMLKGIS